MFGSWKTNVRNILQICLFGKMLARGSIMWVTMREQEVLGLLLQGCTNKEIARQLSISDYTVRDHVSSLLRKNQVRTRAELMARCVSLLLPGNITRPPTSVGLRSEPAHT
ncbi:LuxR family transcriptional regulator [Pseudomonas syringae pv. aceris]|uniref:LuxR family transcriptional regulator n=1 Tax=Pseudomonas syringae pv. aceris TaxID=199198 RepID=A0A0P9HSB5_PSESX|nr:LuxR family transcriptional regulator [Pseudomonas syringae pv. aceris]RMR47985.1 LuxR family transcriptional regulator [Pseudomonas syringae pv. syringae]